MTLPLNVPSSHVLSPRSFHRQLFLTDGALHLLVVDLHKFDRDPLSRGNAVYIWLDSLLCRIPGSAVLVVATHADAFGDDHERSAAALEDLEAAITEHLKTKEEARVPTLIYVLDTIRAKCRFYTCQEHPFELHHTNILDFSQECFQKYEQFSPALLTPRSSSTRQIPLQEWQFAQLLIKREHRSQARPASTWDEFNAGSLMNRSKSAPPSLRLCGFILVSGRSLGGIAILEEKIWEVANEPALFPDVRQLVPNIWRRVWAVMDALRVGADPDSAVRLEGPVVAIEGRDKHEFVTQEQAFDAWSRAERKLAGQLEAAGDNSEQLPLALSRTFQVRWCC